MGSSLLLAHLEVLLEFLNVSIGFWVVDSLVFENGLSNSALIDDMIACIRIFDSFRSSHIFLLQQKMSQEQTPFTLTYKFANKFCTYNRKIRSIGTEATVDRYGHTGNEAGQLIRG